MIVVDYIAIAIVVIAGLMGYFIGFGKGLQNVTSGIVGFIISLIACWFLFGIVLNWGFVQNLLAQFIQALKNNGSGFCNFLITIRIDLIVTFIAVLIIVEILRIIILKFLRGIFEANNTVMKIVNKVLGILLFLIYFTAIILLVLQICYMIWGAQGPIFNFLQGSTFRLDKLYLNNPLNSFINLIRNTVGI